jgi:dihydroneopterin aldolase
MTPSLKISGIRFHAFHGCLEEESRIGNEYTVDVEFDTNIARACTHDSLADTIDYVAVHSIVEKEMKVRSKLIEHVALRILQALRQSFPACREIKVHLTKHRPPINGGYLGSATVSLSSNDF